LPGKVWETSCVGATGGIGGLKIGLQYSWLLLKHGGGAGFPEFVKTWTKIAFRRRTAHVPTKLYKLFHSGRQLNGLAVNHERAATMMMNGAGMFL
jgi:hypothetical protein